MELATAIAEDRLNDDNIIDIGDDAFTVQPDAPVNDASEKISV